MKISVQNLNELSMRDFVFGVGSEPSQKLGIAFENQEGTIQHGVWESGPGELLLNFDWDETAFILDGRATAENTRTGEHWDLIPGSMIFFKSGSQWRIQIPWKVKKVFTIVARVL